MPEAEVSLRLAEYLLELPGADSDAYVAIDGACVAVHGQVVCDIEGFLAGRGWMLQKHSGGKNPWTGHYVRNGHSLHIGSHPGKGDVWIRFGPRRVVAECKKGPLKYRKGSPERVLLQAALGQALVWPVAAGDIVVVAVPYSDAFDRLATEFRQRPLVQKAGIQICLVDQSGQVFGFAPT